MLAFWFIAFIKVLGGHLRFKLQSGGVRDKVEEERVGEGCERGELQGWNQKKERK